MPVSKPSKLGELMDALREWLPGAKPRAVEWWSAVREEPALVWRSTAFRVTCLVGSGLVLLVVVSTIASWIEPPRPEGFGQVARSANFDVVCSEPSCSSHFVISRKFSFRKFPVTCIKCKQKTGVRGLRCMSASCGGKLVAAQESDLGTVCPLCGEVFANQEL